MNKLYEENDIQNIANSIRNKGINGNFTVAQMASNIDNISGGTDLSNCLVWSTESASPYIGNNYLINNAEFVYRVFQSNFVNISGKCIGLSQLFMRSSLNAGGVYDVKLNAVPSIGYAFETFNQTSAGYLKLNITGLNNCVNLLKDASIYAVDANLHFRDGAQYNLYGIGASYIRSYKLELFPFRNEYNLYLEYRRTFSASTDKLNTLWVNLHNYYANSISLNLFGSSGSLIYNVNFYLGYSHNIDNSGTLISLPTKPISANIVVNNLYVYNAFYKYFNNGSWSNEENINTNITFNFSNGNFVDNESVNVLCVRRFYSRNVSVYCTE